MPVQYFSLPVDTRPQRAGKARLRYDRKPSQLPHAARETLTIHLPRELRAEEMVPILGGSSLLFQQPNASSVYMVGDDGSSIYVAALAKPINHWGLRQNPTDEQRFLNSLSPTALRRYSQIFDLPLFRQGEFWASPLTPDPEVGNCLSHFGRKGLGGYNTRNVTGYPVFKSRHRIDGVRYTARSNSGVIHLLGQPVEVFSGVLVAPDHDPLVAAMDSVYIVMRTDAFIRPSSE